METLKELFRLLPHIDTFDVAVTRNPGAAWGVDINCSMDDIRPGERFDGIMTITALVLFGFVTIAQRKSDIKPWKNPHDKT